MFLPNNDLYTSFVCCLRPSARDCVGPLSRNIPLPFSFCGYCTPMWIKRRPGLQKKAKIKTKSPQIPGFYIKKNPAHLAYIQIRLSPIHT